MPVSIAPTSGEAGTFITVTTPDCDVSAGINDAIFPEGVPIDGDPIADLGPVASPPFGIAFPDGQEPGVYQIAAYCDDDGETPRSGAALFTLDGPTTPPDTVVDVVGEEAPDADVVEARPSFTG